MEVYELDKASKVWQEAAELGVEGDEEEEEQYVERIMFNERSDDEARILREQQQHCIP